MSWCLIRKVWLEPTIWLVHDIGPPGAEQIGYCHELGLPQRHSFTIPGAGSPKTSLLQGTGGSHLSGSPWPWTAVATSHCRAGSTGLVGAQEASRQTHGWPPYASGRPSRKPQHPSLLVTSQQPVP